jgi:hypothetical protein
MSQYKFEAEMLYGNKTFLGKLFYSHNAKKFLLNTIECGIKVEFYGFNDEINTNCYKLEENTVRETFLENIRGYTYFFECFDFDTHKIRNQKMYSKFSPFLKISANEKLFSEMNFKTNTIIDMFPKERYNMKETYTYDFYYLTLWMFYSKLTETYLESPYKSQCSHYNTNTNLFDSVSYSECKQKCIEKTCFRNYNCSAHHKTFRYQIKEGSIEAFKHHYFICSNHILKDCERFEKQCEIICPIDCIKDDYILEELFASNDNVSNSEKVLKLFWDSGQTLILYEETPNMLLLDYFTHIGGVFGLWFGICVQNMMGIIINNAKSLKNYLNVKSKMLFTLISLFLKSFSTSLFHCINYSIHNRFDLFTHFVLWFGICLKSSMDLIVKNAKIFGNYLKVLPDVIFSLVLLFLKLFNISFLYLINWLIYIYNRVICKN